MTYIDSPEYNVLSPASRAYLGKKFSVGRPRGEGSIFLEGPFKGQVDTGVSGVADTLEDINKIITYKGGQAVSDWNQVDSALQPLIAKRNKKGLGGLGSLLSIAAPVALSFLAPGLGTAIGAGLGLSGTAAGAVGGGILGAGLSGAGSALTGGKVLKDALIGGVSGGLSGAGNFLGTAGKIKNGAMTSGSGLFGAMSNQGGTLANLAKGASSLTNGAGRLLSGALGAPMKGGSALTGGFSGIPSMGSGGTMGRLSDALGGFMTYQAQSDAEKEMKRAQREALNAVNPYRFTGANANSQLSKALSAGFDPSNLENDAGYRFRFAQGDKALGRSLSASGMGQSGAAIKAAQEYAQNFAANEYGDAYQRWLAKNQQLAGVANAGLGASGTAAGIYDRIGDIGANSRIARNNTIQGTLASILSGAGRRVVGYDAQGNPVYA